MLIIVNKLFHFRWISFLFFKYLRLKGVECWLLMNYMFTYVYGIKHSDHGASTFILIMDMRENETQTILKQNKKHTPI